jgi:hypothetical protein
MSSVWMQLRHIHHTVLRKIRVGKRPTSQRRAFKLTQFLSLGKTPHLVVDGELSCSSQDLTFLMKLLICIPVTY